MPKRANPMAVKAALTYDVSEAARALGKSPATLRNWIQDGFPIMATRKPYLISGAALREYLRAKYGKPKTILSSDELYCLCCQAGRHPVDMAVVATPNNSKTTRLRGICLECGAKACRLVSNASVSQFARTFRFKTCGRSDA